jgi:hypothetical protein
VADEDPDTGRHDPDGSCHRNTDAAVDDDHNASWRAHANCDRIGDVSRVGSIANGYVDEDVDTGIVARRSSQ